MIDNQKIDGIINLTHSVKRTDEISNFEVLFLGEISNVESGVSENSCNTCWCRIITT